MSPRSKITPRYSRRREGIRTDFLQKMENRQERRDPDAHATKSFLKGLRTRVKSHGAGDSPKGRTRKARNPSPRAKPKYLNNHRAKRRWRNATLRSNLDRSKPRRKGPCNLPKTLPLEDNLKVGPLGTENILEKWSGTERWNS